MIQKNTLSKLLRCGFYCVCVLGGETSVTRLQNTLKTLEISVALWYGRDWIVRINVSHMAEFINGLQRLALILFLWSTFSTLGSWLKLHMYDMSLTQFMDDPSCYPCVCIVEGGCTRHSDCPSDEYCNEDRRCEECFLCFELDDGHNGECPMQCSGMWRWSVGSPPFSPMFPVAVCELKGACLDTCLRKQLYTY